jgi:hypothetical protein
LGTAALVYAFMLLFVMGQKDFYFDLAAQIRNRQRPALGEA